MVGAPPSCLVLCPDGDFTLVPRQRRNVPQAEPAGNPAGPDDRRTVPVAIPKRLIWFKK
jgi:hypothetical protein